MAWRMTSVFALVAIITIISLSSVMADGIHSFAHSGRAFSKDLYAAVSDSQPGKNLIFSPFSIQTCVGLAFAGADGKTAEEIAKGLHLVSNDRKVVGDSFKNVLDQYEKNPSLKIANKFYIKEGFEVQDTFNQIATESFHSEAENIDFVKNVEAAKAMNGWVEDHTNGKIKDLITEDSIDKDTRMVLINAIHFKAEWIHKFSKPSTRPDDFWISETESVKVDMMNNKDHYKYGVFKDLDATGLEMPYKNNFSMFVLLPNSKTGLKELEKKIQNVDIQDLQKQMSFSEVAVKFPKFKAELQLDLKDTLTKMGMGTMFSDGADFSHLLKSPELLKVSKVIHKAFIDVMEDGTEAAAATAMMIGIRYSKWLSDSPPLIFFVDKPFIYLIKHDNENIPIFYGSFLGIPK